MEINIGLEELRSNELLQAVCENNLRKIEEILKEDRILLDNIYRGYDQSIFLIACGSCNVETVETLLAFGANCSDSRSDNGWAPIHFAANRTSYKILEVLLQHSPKCINDIEKYGNNALHFLIRYGDKGSEEFLKCAELLFKSGIDLHQLNTKNRTPLKMISEMHDDEKGIQTMLENMAQKFGKIPPVTDDHQKLLECLYSSDEENCIKEIDKITDLKLINECFPNTCSTLLQEASTKGLLDVVKHLLSKGVDATKTTQKTKAQPVILAATKGYRDIVNVLLESVDLQKIPNELLGCILEYIDSEYTDFVGCYNVFMKKIKYYVPKNQPSPPEVLLKINSPYHMNDTPLHYAVWSAGSEIVKELLCLGAFLGAKNKSGDTPINNIEVEILEDHLDNSIIFDSSINRRDPEFKVEFNFQSLIPPQYVTKLNLNTDAEASKIVSNSAISETEVIAVIAKSPEMKKLLVHPVIVSFLTLKWQQYQFLFWTDLTLSLIFAFLLLLYIPGGYFEYTITSPPSVLKYIIILNILDYGLAIIVAILLLRELFRVYIDPTGYFKSINNYIEITLICITCIMLSGIFTLVGEERQFGALAILLLAYKLIVMLGKHPYFSTHATMLAKVSSNFLEALFIYSILIFAFAFSFHVLFNGTRENKNQPEIQNKYFNNIGRAVFKTVIMLTGEFDSGEVDFDTFYIISKLIFVFFIFIMHLILLNLLSGLAVNDTQQIRDEAQLFGYIAIVNYIKNIETTLSEKQKGAALIEIIRKIVCCFSGEKEMNYPSSYGFNSEQIDHYQLTFYPNINSFALNSSKSHSYCRHITKLKLDKETIKKIRNIIQTRCKRMAKISPKSESV